jgi:hypothetical protein
MDALAVIAVFSVRAGSRLARSQFAFLARIGRTGGKEGASTFCGVNFRASSLQESRRSIVFKPSHLFRLGQALVEGGIHQ